MNDIANSSAPATPPPLSSPLPQGLLAWMSFFAIMNMIGGAVHILSCFGIPIGIFMLIGGMALMAAKTALEKVEDIPPSLEVFFEKLKTFMVMMGVLCIITILFSLLLAILMSIAPLFLQPIIDSFNRGGF